MGSVFQKAARLSLPVAAVSLGLLSPLESCPWAALFLFVPLALVLKEEGPLNGVLAAWFFGTAAWAAGTFWVVNALDTMMHMPGWQIPPAAFCLWLYQGLPFAGLGLVCGWANRCGRPAGPLFCAALLTLLVFFRPPLCPVSSVVSVALWPRFIQIADLGGETLVFFGLILINFLLADALARLVRGRTRQDFGRAFGQAFGQAFGRAAAGGLVLAGILGYGTLCLSLYNPPGPRAGTRSLAVASVQPNAPPPVFWGRKGFPLEAFATPEDLCLRQLNIHRDLVREADLVVFPELPRFDCRDREFVLSGLEEALQQLKVPLLLAGAEFIYAAESRELPQGDADRKIIETPILAKYNSVFVMAPGTDRPSPVYRKIKRVPFSEASPFNLPWRKRLEVSKGDGIRLIRIRDLSVQPLICFESGFSDLVRQGISLGADLLVEFSNDGWFAARDAEMKHLGMAVFRAVEARRPLVRCSNSGGGAHVLASGEIIPGTLTPHDASWVTRASVLCPEGLTVYLRMGGAWLWILAGIVAWQTGAAMPWRQARGPAAGPHRPQ